MRHFLLAFLLVFTMYSQAAEPSGTKKQLIGQILSKGDNKGIPYATLTIRTDSTHVLLRKSADGDGKFTLNITANDTLQLVVTATGFQEMVKDLVVQTEKLDLSTISLEEGLLMKTVTVTGQKALVRIDPDKITYSVESDPDGKTSNGLEILRKVPLLAVDGEENVTLNGQSNFKVLINGKSSSMMSKNFKEVIKSLPANSIKDIEVITNPSTKYESEGIGGIINIITFRKTLNGYNGSVSMGADNWGSINSNLSLSTKINKVGVSGMYSINENKRPPSESASTSENFLSDVYRYTTSASKSSGSGYSQQYSGELSYDIDTFNLISGSFWGYTSESSSNQRSSNRIESANRTLTQYFAERSNGGYSYGTVSGNLDFQKTYLKPDKSLTFSYKFDLSPQNSNFTNHIDSTYQYNPYTQKSLSDEISQEHTFQMDYYDPLSEKHQLEWGFKFIYRGNENNSTRWRNDSLRSDLSNSLQYDQYILGAYAGYVRKWKKLTAKGGFRLERTWNIGESTSDSTVRFTNKLFNLVPYINFSYQFKPTQTIRLSYTQRLQRPGVYYLNPYVENSNPLYVSYGNPHLKSELSHSFDVNYSTFSNHISWNTSLSASINNNSIESVSKSDSMGVTTSTYDNIGLDQRYNWNNYISYQNGSKYNLYVSATGSYGRYASNNGMNLSNDGFSFNFYGGFRASLWKNGSMNGNIGYSSPRVYLQGKSTGYSYTSIGFGQYFLKRQMQISLSVSDPFTSKRYQEGDQTGLGYTSHYSYFYYTRTARLSLSYNFGKLDMAVKKARRGISNDDVKGGGSK